MKTLSSRVTQKGQTTIPSDIRSALHIQTGDTVLFFWDEKKNSVTLKRATPLDTEYLLSAEKTLGEWNSAEDDRHFSDWEDAAR